MIKFLYDYDQMIPLLKTPRINNNIQKKISKIVVFLIIETCSFFYLKILIQIINYRRVNIFLILEKLQK